MLDGHIDLDNRYVFLQNVENLSPQVIRQIAKEVSDLANDPPEGIKVYPNDEDITDIQATIEGPGEYYGWNEFIFLQSGKNRGLISTE